jgi:hypothetical protein
MRNLLFLRRSCEYRHAAVAAFRKARRMPLGSERTVARALARGLRDLARAEAWLEGQSSQPNVRKAATLRSLMRIEPESTPGVRRGTWRRPSGRGGPPLVMIERVPVIAKAILVRLS